MSDMQVIRPGDTILVRLDPRVSAAGAARTAKALKERFPECEICILDGGVTGIDVYRPDDTEDEPG